MIPRIRSRAIHCGTAAAIYMFCVMLLTVVSPVSAIPSGEGGSSDCLRGPEERDERPASKVDTLSVGDALCNVRFRLVEGDRVFSTYVPDQVVEKLTETDRGTSAWFFAAYGGMVRQNTYLHIYLPAEKMSISDLRNLVAAGDGLGPSAGWELTPLAVPDRPEVVDAFSFRAIDDHGVSEGFIHIVDYGDCPFLVMVRSSQEYAQTFLPCADRILSEMQWKPDRRVNTSAVGDDANVTALAEPNGVH